MFGAWGRILVRRYALTLWFLIAGSGCWASTTYSATFYGTHFIRDGIHRQGLFYTVVFHSTVYRRRQELRALGQLLGHAGAAMLFVRIKSRPLPLIPLEDA
ncbi:hypothetical protein F4806DRAFT_446428 [Annulohypoxylon nitens]|nr:hypothetical protein F4806DRAFT_446428 [Annulohypoxylon nitens]